MDFLTEAKKLLKENVQFLTEPDDYKLALSVALDRYSKDKPYVKVQSYDGDGSTSVFDLPSDFLDLFSVILKIVYPVDDEIEYLLDPEDWTIRRTPTGLKLYLSFTPASGEQMWVEYTTKHEYTYTVDLDDTKHLYANSVYSGDETAVLHLMVAELYGMIASHFAQTKDDNLGTEVIQMESKVEKYLKLQEKYENLYLSHMGKKDKPRKAASGVRSFDRYDTFRELTDLDK